MSLTSTLLLRSWCKLNPASSLQLGCLSSQSRDHVICDFLLGDIPLPLLSSPYRRHSVSGGSRGINILSSLHYLFMPRTVYSTRGHFKAAFMTLVGSTIGKILLSCRNAKQFTLTDGCWTSYSF